MKRAMLASILPLALPLVATSALAGNMKAGLWEIKMTKQIVDGEDIQAQMRLMQQQLAGLPPQQRKQMEAMLKQQGIGMGPGGATRICIGRDQARRNMPVIDLDDRCQPTKLTRSGNTVRFEIDCTMDGSRMQGKGLSTTTSNSVYTRMDVTTTDESGRHTMQSESQMRYLGPDCKGLPPGGTSR